MSKIDVSHVSSNWKKLQAQLTSEKKIKTEAQSKSKNVCVLKRKRSSSSSSSSSSTSEWKKTRISGGNSGVLGQRKKRKMGAGESQPAGRQTEDRSKLVREYGIAAEDVSAAYATTTPGAIRRSDDDVNGGLHPTHKIGKYVALDCEMVGTGPPPHDDNLLARASLVNFHGEQIYDSYVRPPPGQVVKDYRTYVSGIKPAHIRPNYARPFAQVQNDVARLLEGRILVGHALRNDLQVLLLSHPKRDLRDTSRYAKYRIESRGKPPALRKLVKSELGLDIQTGEHSSIEDARASMMLFKKEKAGFEEENRKVFGQPRRAQNQFETIARTGKATKTDEKEDEDEDEEEEESEILDGEEDDEDLDALERELGGGDDGDAIAIAQTRATPAAAAKKKRKKKKRTKRH